MARRYGLQVFALKPCPNRYPLCESRASPCYASEGTTWFLDTYGFDFDAVSSGTWAAALILPSMNLFVPVGLSSGRAVAAALESFFAGGGDYIGIGGACADVSIQLGLSTGVEYSSGSGNGIVRVVYDPADPVSAQYPEDSYAFVYRPTFFTDAGTLDVSASISEADDFFVSGYWSGWENSGAAGQAVVLHGATGASSVTLIGIDPTFRAHPEHTFRILANAIYSSLD